MPAELCSKCGRVREVVLYLRAKRSGKLLPVCGKCHEKWADKGLMPR
jgi:hypothetical protein